MPETQASHALPGILASIVRTKREELEALRPHAQRLEREAADAPAPRDFFGALRAEGVSVIAECKRRSPGAGDIRTDVDPAWLASVYERAGAAAMSVLTDRVYFGGQLDDLDRARSAASLPVLRKDFTIDPLHVVEARAGGADAVLLIVRILDDAQLQSLLRKATDLGMAALVEAHDAEEVERAVQAGSRIIGINNRDLASFTTDLDTTLRALDAVPSDVVVVSESGIRAAEDVARLGRAGVDAVLVGEAILAAPEPGAAAAALTGQPRRSRSLG